MEAKQQQELIEFLRDNLKVEVSCGSYDPTIQVTVSLCGKQISSSCDYLSPSVFDRGGDWPGY